MTPSEQDLAAALQQVEGSTTKAEDVALPFACDVCGERFARSQDKAGHARKTGHKKDKSATTDKAPKRTATGTAKKTPSRSQLERRLAEQFAGIGLVVSAFDPHCGGVVVVGSDRLATAWAKVAQQNAAVRKILEGLLETSVWGEAVIATAMVALPILQHHGALPSDIRLPIPTPPEVEDLEDALG